MELRGIQKPRMKCPFKKGHHYKHSRMIAAHFEVVAVRYVGDKYCKLHVLWWTHDGKCCTGISERNLKVMAKDWGEYRKVKGQE